MCVCACLLDPMELWEAQREENIAQGLVPTSATSVSRKLYTVYS